MKLERIGTTVYDEDLESVFDFTAQRPGSLLSHGEKAGLLDELVRRWNAGEPHTPRGVLDMPTLNHFICDKCEGAFPRETHLQFGPCPICQPKPTPPAQSPTPPPASPSHPDTASPLP